MKKHPHYFSIILQKALAELISETRRGYMGMLWWILEPILYMSVFYLVFVVLLHRGGENRVAFLLIGLVVWKWFATSIPQCGNCILANSGLIRLVYMPKWVFPGMVVTTTTIKFFVVFSLLLAFLLITGLHPGITWLSIPLVMVVQVLMMLAIGSILASIVPFLPDLKLVIENGMLMLFFMAGIFFNISTISSHLREYLYLDPMTGLIESYRNILLHNQWPDLRVLGVTFVASVFGLWVGYFMLHRFDRIYVKVI